MTACLVHICPAAAGRAGGAASLVPPPLMERKEEEKRKGSAHRGPSQPCQAHQEFPNLLQHFVDPEKRLIALRLIENKNRGCVLYLSELHELMTCNSSQWLTQSSLWCRIANPPMDAISDPISAETSSDGMWDLAKSVT